MIHSKYHTRNKRWSKEEANFVLDNKDKMKIKDIAEHLSRSKGSVKHAIKVRQWDRIKTLNERKAESVRKLKETIRNKTLPDIIVSQVKINQSYLHLTIGEHVNKVISFIEDLNKKKEDGYIID